MLMFKCIDENQKVNVNFNSWKNRQNLTVNRQSYTPFETLFLMNVLPRPQVPLQEGKKGGSARGA